MAYFDIEHYNKLMSTNNYLGMANYLEQHPVQDKNSQMLINQQIARLKEQDAIRRAILKNSTNDDALKFAFKESLDSGIYDSSNNYFTTYKKHWDDLGNSENGKLATRLRVITGQDAFDNFLRSLNVEQNQLKDLGISLGSNTDGRYIIEFNKNVPQYHKIANALSTMSYMEHDVQAGFDYAYNVNSDLYGLDSKGNVIYKGDTSDDNISSMVSMYNDAKDVAQNLLEQATNHNYVTKSVNTPFLGAADEKLFNLYASGRIDKQTYDEHKKIRQEHYDRLLAQVPFSQIEVYSTGIDGDETETLRLMEDNIERGKLSDYIRVALSENRVTYSSANVGGVIGVMITVSAKPDNEGKIKGDYNKSRQLFVPGLWQDKAEEDLAANTATRAARTFNVHQAFGHDYQHVRGDKIYNFTPNGATYQDRDGNIMEISNDDVIRIMDENHCYDMAVELINSDYRDENGNLIKPEEIKTRIKTIVSQEILELYGNRSESYQAARSVDLYTAIMKAIGFDTENS